MAKRRQRQSRPAGRQNPKTKRGADVAPAERRPTKAERLAAARRARRRKALLIRIAVSAVATAVVVAIVSWQVISRRNAQRVIAAMTSGDCTYDTRSDPGQVNEHGASPSFSVNPPAGGVHLASAARAGIYGVQAAPEDGLVVHALEHGFIAIFHQPDLADDHVRALQLIADEFSRDVLLIARSNLDVPVAATAWHRRLLCGSVEVPSIRRFVEEYRGEGPEKVPRE